MALHYFFPRTLLIAHSMVSNAISEKTQKWVLQTSSSTRPSDSDFFEIWKKHSRVSFSKTIVTCRNFKADNDCLGPCHFIYIQRNKKINQHPFLLMSSSSDVRVIRSAQKKAPTAEGRNKTWYRYTMIVFEKLTRACFFQIVLGNSETKLLPMKFKA